MSLCVTFHKTERKRKKKARRSPVDEGETFRSFVHSGHELIMTLKLAEYKKFVDAFTKSHPNLTRSVKTLTKINEKSGLSFAKSFEK